jgi:hypothetical protein
VADGGWSEADIVGRLGIAPTGASGRSRGGCDKVLYRQYTVLYTFTPVQDIDEACNFVWFRLQASKVAAHNCLVNAVHYNRPYLMRRDLRATKPS